MFGSALIGVFLFCRLMTDMSFLFNLTLTERMENICRRKRTGVFVTFTHFIGTSPFVLFMLDWIWSSNSLVECLTEFLNPFNGWFPMLTLKLAHNLSLPHWFYSDPSLSLSLGLVLKLCQLSIILGDTSAAVCFIALDNVKLSRSLLLLISC